MPQSVLYSIEDFNLKDQRVFIRTDFNVPVKDGQPIDHVRLRASLSTIRYALENRAKVIIGSHRGRPKRLNRDEDKKQFTLEPFGYYLGQKLNCEVLFIDDIQSPVPDILIRSLNSQKIILLENLRFASQEEKPHLDWTKSIASYVDIYINEAFSVSHRTHTSIYHLPLEVKQRGQGLSLKKEKQTLDYVRFSSPSPMVLIIGGGYQKIKDKIQTISRLIDRIDVLIVGGAMAYSFLKVQGVCLGATSVSKEEVNLFTEIINRLKEKNKTLLLPLDHLVISVDSKIPESEVIETKDSNVPKNFCAMDIGPRSRELFSQTLKSAQTIFWNGPMGRFENPAFAKGTLSICQAIGSCNKAFRVVGGGDSISAVFKFGCADYFNYISTGGGASLKYLETGSLPGIQSLMSEVIISDKTKVREDT